MHKAKNPFTIKQNNAYSCISNDRLKFLDVCNYLAPGTSYSSFLKAFGIEEQKGYFCYEWFDSVDKLKYKNLPAYNHFYSELKGFNVLEEEILQWEKHQRGPPPKSGIQKYNDLQNIWKEKNMSSFRDFLEWYNNLDVSPLIKAVSALQNFYKSRSIDVFKTTISVPGVARQMCFESAINSGATFALFDNTNKDLYHKICNNIVGGPSIIFKRHAKAGETKIRGGDKLAQRIVGYDANALYLWAMSQKFPVGGFIRRMKNSEFKPEIRDKFMISFHWLDYVSTKNNVVILHKMNNKREKRIGPYLIDGFCSSTKTCYEFNGCFFHGHVCELTTSQWLSHPSEMLQKQRKTQEKLEFLQKKGYKVEVIYECEFQKMCKHNSDLQHFIDRKRPSFYQSHKSTVSEKQILDAVRSETLFGMIECDIQVPDRWDDEFSKKMKLSPKEYFSEMSPIFMNSDIHFDHIGEHMQNHIKRFGLSQKPRRLLVGGMKADHILLATPLLKFYLDHGLKVTNIHECIEFSSQNCFKSFVTEVATKRREGDLDKDKSIIADLMKLIGNSAFGSMIMNKQKHSTVTYIEDENKACMKVNDPNFKNLTELDPIESYYEVQMFKKKLVMDMPIQIGFFILQYAKLRMLSFYYDCIDICVDRENFECMEMDTDSLYIAIAGKSLLDVIKPEMREHFLHGLQGFCTNQDIEPDTIFHWFPRTCCDQHKLYDKRTPGLMKLEYEGELMIGLCSKTYMIRNGDDVKFSSKGISKQKVKDPEHIFKTVIETQVPATGVNKGFRARDNHMFSYTQERCGFSYLYMKRKVLDDGIHTVPLEITLKPVDKIYDEFESEVCLVEYSF